MSNTITNSSTPTQARAAGWVSLTYSYKTEELWMLRAAIRQLGSKPCRVLTVPGGQEIFVPGKLNKGLS